jgi:hypothetical protein
MESTLEIGKKLVSLCKQGQWLNAIDTLYSADIKSIEAMAVPSHPQQMNGIAAVREKTIAFTNGHDIHHCEVGGPWPHGDRFIVTFRLDLTAKSGPMAVKRFVIEEAALYTVKGGKIAQEEFFYHMPG